MVDARHVPHRAELFKDGLRAERTGQFDRALAYYRAAEDAYDDAVSRAESLRRQSDVFRQRGDWTAALDAVRRSAKVAIDAGLTEFFAEALNAEGAIHLSRGRPLEAASRFEQVVQRSSSSRIRAAAVQNLGCAAAMRSDFDEADGCFRDARRIFDEADDARGVAAVVVNHGAAAIDRGDLGLGEQLCERAVTAARRANDLTFAATAAKNYAEALIAQGKLLHQAEGRLISAFGFFSSAGEVQGQVPCMRLLGDLYIARGEPGNAIRPYGTALRLARRTGLPHEARRLEERLRELGANVPSSDPPSSVGPIHG